MEVFLEWLGDNRMDIPGALRLMDAEAQFEHRLTDLQGSYTGLERIEAAFEDVVEHFDALKVDCPDIRDLGDRVLALALPTPPAREAALRPSCHSRSWRASGTDE